MTNTTKGSRVVAVLTLGAVGLVVCQPLGLLAWFLGSRSLAAMDAGVIPSDGRTLVRVGRILGIVGAALFGVQVAALGAYILIETEVIPNPFAAEFVLPPPPPKPQVRRPQARQTPKSDAATIQELVRQVETGDESSRIAAAARLGLFGVGAGAATPALIRALADESHAVRDAALDALRRIGTDHALAAVEEYESGP